MRILWIKIGGLWPVDRGGRRRSFEILSALSRRHEVSVLTTHGHGDDPRGLRSALPHCRRIDSVPFTLASHGTARFAAALMRSWMSPLPVDMWKCRVPAIHAAAQRALDRGRIDVVVADFLTAMANVPDTDVPVVLFEHNVEHILWRRLAAAEQRPWRRALLEIEWRKMRQAEARALARSDLTIAVSEVDRNALAALQPNARSAVVATGVDTRYFAPNGFAEDRHAIAFSGAMDWYPNDQAVQHFLHRIWPRVRRAVPSATFTAIGRNPSEALRAAAREHAATVTGTVEDVRPHLGAAQVVVVPLRIGGGTRLKIFEALAMGKAVVSTALGAEGLPVKHGRHLLLADTDDAFARAIVSLLHSPTRRVALGTAGRRLVQQHYSWSRIARVFAAQAEEVCCHAR